MMRQFWSFLSNIYCELYCAGLPLPKPKILFHQPSKKLNCEYRTIIWADTSFTHQERLLILEALDDLHLFCNGIIQLEIIFELDPNDTGAISNNNVLLRVAADHPAIKASDNKIELDTIGLCNYMQNQTKRLYLVPERLYNPIMFKTTATHELGHFIHLDHTKRPSIMHKSNFNNVLYPTYLDAVEMARVWSLHPNDFRYFKL